jgi:cytochrome c-type biogenesis protein CcmH
MTMFVILVGAMLVVALAFPLVPLLRHRQALSGASDADARKLKALNDALSAGVIDDCEHKAKLATLAPAAAVAPGPGSTRGSLLASLLVALLVPAGAIVLYSLNGDPRALDPAQLAASVEQNPAGSEATAQPADMDLAIAGLVAKLEANPDNANGWALLGRAYQATGKFAESRDALKRAFELEPDNHDLTVEYAQALALSGEGRRITGESRDLIERVLKADPAHQRALWLIGISDYQAGDYNAAITAWNQLLPGLPPDSDIAKSVREQIAEAQRLGGSVAAADVAAAPTAPAEASGKGMASPAAGPALTVNVSLDPNLLERLDPAATLFVFARAENGPPMPLAIQRLSAAKLPLTVTLDDSMGMLPSMKLSMFPKVVVGARISRSGNALAQSGDLQVLANGIDVARKQPLDLVIDSIVP